MMRALVLALALILAGCGAARDVAEYLGACAINPRDCN